MSNMRDRAQGLIAMSASAPEKVPERVKGYLTVTIAEASGRNRDDEEVWDPAFVEGYVKGAALCWLSLAGLLLRVRYL